MNNLLIRFSPYYRCHEKENTFFIFSIVNKPADTVNVLRMITGEAAPGR